MYQLLHGNVIEQKFQVQKPLHQKPTSLSENNLQIDVEKFLINTCKA